MLLQITKLCSDISLEKSVESNTLNMDTETLNYDWLILKYSYLKPTLLNSYNL